MFNILNSFEEYISEFYSTDENQIVFVQQNLFIKFLIVEVNVVLFFLQIILEFVEILEFIEFVSLKL